MQAGRRAHQPGKLLRGEHGHQVVTLVVVAGSAYGPSRDPDQPVAAQVEGGEGRSGRQAAGLQAAQLVVGQVEAGEQVEGRQQAGPQGGEQGVTQGEGGPSAEAEGHPRCPR